MAKGVQQLDTRKTFAELFGLAEEGQTEKVHIARTLALSKQTGKVVAVYNYAEYRGGILCGRPPGWGMPGGKALGDETPLDAIKKHEYGEVPWRMSEPKYLFSDDVKDRGDRLEQTHFFLTEVDEGQPTAFTADEAREISCAEFFDIEEILRAATVDVGSTDLEPHPERYEFYRSHKGFFARAWRKYQEMKANGEIK